MNLHGTGSAHESGTKHPTGYLDAGKAHPGLELEENNPGEKYPVKYGSGHTGLYYAKILVWVTRLLGEKPHRVKKVRKASRERFWTKKRQAKKGENARQPICVYSQDLLSASKVRDVEGPEQQIESTRSSQNIISSRYDPGYDCGCRIPWCFKT